MVVRAEEEDAYAEDGQHEEAAETIEGRTAV